MNVEFFRRAVADLRRISSDSLVFGDAVAAAVEARIREIVIYLSEHPEGPPRVADRLGVRVMPLIRYPYKIFYRVLSNRVRVLHIRHASRQPWRGG
jgi:toxin ParE1/3/4